MTKESRIISGEVPPYRKGQEVAAFMAFLSHNVFRHRLETIRKYLLQTNSKALIVLNPDNFFYVSGFFLDVAPWERPVAAIIPVDAEPALALCEIIHKPCQDGQGARQPVAFQVAF